MYTLPVTIMIVLAGEFPSTETTDKLDVGGGALAAGGATTDLWERNGHVIRQRYICGVWRGLT